jgi:hypothetical protein
MFPVLPGKEDAARAFAKETVGARREQFAAEQGQASVSRETWTLQQTPMGSFVLVWFEGDVEAAFANLAEGQDEFNVWMRKQIQDLTGVDMAAPNEDPLPEVLLDWAK